MYIGQKIGSYSVTRLIGAGAMGTVYEGRDETIYRRVAIKHLQAAHAADRELFSRFLTEARVVNQIAHPGLVSTYQFGQFPDGGAYIVMEYLDGETLAWRLKNRAEFPLTSDEACQFMRQVADTLSVVHGHRVVHRDIKPANLMLIPDSAIPCGTRVKVLDFGIAKVRSAAKDPNNADTRAGIAMGTPLYIAPEQIFGAATVDAAADVYSLGVVFFECLVGHPPFEGDDEQKTLMAHVTKPIPDLEKVAPHAPRQVRELVAQMLAKKPEERPTAVEIVARLDAINRTTIGELSAAKGDQSDALRRSWQAAIATALLLGATAGTLLSLNHRRRDTLARPATAQPSSPSAPAGNSDGTSTARTPSVYSAPTSPVPTPLGTESKPIAAEAERERLKGNQPKEQTKKVGPARQGLADRPTPPLKTATNRARDSEMATQKPSRPQNTDKSGTAPSQQDLELTDAEIKTLE